MSAPRLDRSSWPAAPRPARIVHLGAGNFSRAHQAWYTMLADPAREWGIAAFTGRRPALAQALTPQQGLYALIERGPCDDRVSVIDTLQEVRPGGDMDGLVAAIASPLCAIVTLTVTEAGYGPAPAGATSGRPATAPATPPAPAAVAGAPPVPERLALALAVRRAGGGGPLALVSCDNLHRNGAVLRERVVGVAQEREDGLAEWMQASVSFVSTSVDRITPPAGEPERELVERELGLHDSSPVVCEPFSDWVLCGDFPAGRPRWEDAGARFVTDIEPWELRKLWLLNGGHCLLAYMGLERGHETVADAFSDRELAGALEAFWDLAARHLPGAAELDLDAYRAALRERFANPRIGYPLEVIAGDGLDKLRNRVVPVISAARAAGERAEPALAIVRAWARRLVEDPGRAQSDQNAALLRGVIEQGDATMDRLLGLLAPGLRWEHEDDHG